MEEKGKDRWYWSEVAEIFHITEVTLWRWEKAGCPMPTARRRTRGRPRVFTQADIRKIEKWRDTTIEV